ncbi:hypothetical protein BCR32DRAFT_324032, partial [Anaeromyces robustus]
MDFSIPTCVHAQRYYNNITLFNEMLEAKNYYIDICETNIKKEVKEEVITECMNYMEKDKCGFDYKPEMSDDELSQKCEIHYSDECYYSQYDLYIPCELAKKFNEEEIQSAIENHIKKYRDTDEICNYLDYPEWAIKTCEKGINTKMDCIFNDEPVDNNDLIYRCISFLDNKCQNFYENQWDNALICKVAERFENIEIFNKSNKWYKYYDEACNSII